MKVWSLSLSLVLMMIGCNEACRMTSAEVKALSNTKSFLEAGGDVNSFLRRGVWSPRYDETGNFVNKIIGYARLHEAAENGWRAVGELLISKGADVNAEAPYGMPLHYAAEAGYKDFAKILLAHGADVNAKTQSGRTPLHYAAQKGRQDLVKILLANGARVNTKDHNEKTPLMLAMFQSHSVVVKQLITDGAVFDIEYRDKCGRTLLHFAALQGFPEVTRDIIAKGVDVNVMDITGQTPLYYVVSVPIKRSWATPFYDLIESVPRRTDPRSRDPDLSKVVTFKGRITVARYLLANGAKVNHKDIWDRRPLHYAVRAGNANMVNLLVSRGADVNATEYQHLKPLHMALLGGHKDIANILVTEGAHIDIFTAAGLGKLDHIRNLLKADGKQVNTTDNYGLSPLHWAAGNGYIGVCKFLINKGADVNAKAISGTTPLMLAISSGHKRIAELLMARGAVVHTENSIVPSENTIRP